ncbi:MAG: hypothetical protein ABIG20_03710 [archaeon]
MINVKFRLLEGYTERNLLEQKSTMLTKPSKFRTFIERVNSIADVQLKLQDITIGEDELGKPIVIVSLPNMSVLDLQEKKQALATALGRKSVNDLEIVI